MKKVAIIQARTSSTRLPNKVLLTIFGKTILEHIINRVQHAELIDDICVATTTESEDDVIEAIGQKCSVTVYRGSKNDVLDRFYQTALMTKADVICRITADDPFKDPQVLNDIMNVYLNGKYDYVSNTLEPTYPEGIDIEVFSFATLKSAWENAVLPSEREHVTPYIWKHPDMYRLFSVKYEQDLSEMRWTLDHAADWVFVQQIYDKLYHEEKIFLMRDVLQLLKEYPFLSDVNKNFIRNEGYIKSIANEEGNEYE